MHVLYLIDSLSGGGAEQSLAALAPSLVRNGVTLDVAHLKDGAGVEGQLREAGANLYSLAHGGGRPGWIRTTHALLKQRRPDLLHTTLFEADIAGRIAALRTRTPVVSSLVNVTYGPEQFADPRLKAWRLRGAQVVDIATARRVVRWHAITGHVAEVMSARLRVPSERIDVIPRGRDPERLGKRTLERRARARAMVGVGDDQPLVVAAARQEHQKGLDVLVRAWPILLQRHPGARLVIAGRDGNQSPRLRALLKASPAGTSIVLLGPRSDVPELLCAADAFAMPSRWEGLGSVLLEAMALETPIVASDLPPVREIVDPVDTASLVPPDDPELLAGALAGVLSDPVEARRRTAAARQRFFDNYTIERVADRTTAFYERAVTSPSRSRLLSPRS